MTGARRPIPTGARALVLCAGAVIGIAGCAEGVLRDDGAVTVATAWPAPVRGRLAEGFPGGVRWVVLDPSDDPGRVARHRRPPDVILGGPRRAYDRLAAEGRLAPFGPGRPWRVARSGRLRWVRVGEGEPDPADSGTPGQAGAEFGDPRRDPLALERARATLASGPWAEGYGALVREAGGAAPGTPARAEWVEPPWDGDPPASSPAAADPLRPSAPWVEGVAVPRGALHPDRAERFLRHLETLGHAGEPPDLEENSAADELLADLLGATLVDAREELRGATESLRASGRPARAGAWMTAPPPWPPASVAKLLRDEATAMPLLETLAAQLAPGADARAWLLRSWLAPERSVDGALLAGIAGAADGRLAREPRFRAWLRGEWTAWARQRYRRVARTAGSAAAAAGPALGVEESAP